MSEKDPGNITTEPWDERLFDCELTREAQRTLDEIARRVKGRNLQPDVEPLPTNDVEDEYDVEIIGSGHSRIVLELPDSAWKVNGDCVVKVQWTTVYRQTAAEIDVWENAGGRLAALLAPILQRSEYKHWSVMPKATRHGDLKPSERREISRELTAELRSLGYRSGDIRPANIGRINGRDVIIDYADVHE